ncbi:apolipoprotein N-acyltransferase [Rhodovulum adriaticum]|nr:apolipoprotein N-acyltransferase [Rhodovulum adriaticum]
MLDPMQARLTRLWQRRGVQMATAIGLGVALALGQAPYGLCPLALAGLTGLTFLISRADGPGQAARLAWAGGAGHFALALSWIVEPFLVDIRTHGWMAPFALAGMAGGLALFWMAAGAFAGWAGRGPRGRALAFALALAAVELARGYVLTGFPWALAGHIWIGTAPVQLAALTGQYGLTLVTALAVALPFALPHGPGRMLGAGLGAALLGGVALWGAARLDTPLPPRPEAPQIRLVQPNAAQHLKWRRDMVPVFWERLIGYTAAPGVPVPDLIVWPETSVPYLLNHADGALATIALAADGPPVMLGIQRRDGPRTHNSLAVIGAGGRVTQLYDKHHLVPFGEYIPLGHILGRFGIKGLAANDVYGYAPGPGPRVLNLGPHLGQALPLICYEAVFPQDLRTDTRPGWLVQITNDAWFGTRSGPYQHLALAQLRAVETGLPMVRAANTGVSAVIDPMGRITHSLPLHTEGALTAPLPPALSATPYARTGDWPIAALLLAALAGFVARRARK